MRAALLLFAYVAIAGCTAIQQSTSMFPNRSQDWRRVATQDDQKRLRAWRTDFTSAIAAARAAGYGAQVDREGILLQPDAAIAGVALPDGDYRCRLIRVGAKAEGDLVFADRDAMRCRVSQDGKFQALLQSGGQQRRFGRIFNSDPIQRVFLGTLVLPGESRSMQYGGDENRDIAGFVEQIGPARWRLVMPAPHFSSQLDVLELTPLAR